MTADTLVLETMDSANNSTAGPATVLNPIWTALLGIAVVVSLYEIWLRNTRKYKLTANMPNPPMLPLIGNGHLVAHLTNAGRFWILR